MLNLYDRELFGEQPTTMVLLGSRRQGNKASQVRPLLGSIGVAEFALSMGAKASLHCLIVQYQSTPLIVTHVSP